MRLLIVSQYFWPENFRINELVVEMVKRGHAVTVLTGAPNYPAGRLFPGYGYVNRKEDYHGVRVVRVPLIPRGNGRGLQLMANYLSFALSASLLGPFLCRTKFDLIFVCQLSPVTVGIPALVLKRIKGIPILFWILDLWPESLAATGAIRSRAILKWVDTLVRFIYHGCDKIVVSSRGFIPRVAARGIPKGQVGFLPNWHEQEYGAVPASGPALPVGFRIVFAGNVGVAQDFETILAAAEILRVHRDIQWVILGDGRQSDWLKDEVGRRGLSETFHLLGRYPPETMPGFFAQADALLVTLKRDPIFALTVPGKIQSYLACGRPIIAALDGEGATLVTEAGAGIAVPAEDAQGLADAVMQMRQMPRDEREDMGKRGQAYCAAHFDRTLLMDRVEGWMKSMCSQETESRLENSSEPPREGTQPTDSSGKHGCL